MALLGQNIDNQQIAAQVGVTPGQVGSVKAHVKMGSYGVITAEDLDRTSPELVDAGDIKFGLERDLQLALRRNIDQLEAGPTIVDDDREKSVASGRIDITARDKDGVSVVVELKAGEADRDAIGQLLSYVGDMMDGENKARGILVARDFTPRAISASRPVSNIRLVRYGFRFNFEALTTASGVPL